MLAWWVVKEGKGERSSRCDGEGCGTSYRSTRGTCLVPQLVILRTGNGGDSIIPSQITYDKSGYRIVSEPAHV